MQITIGGVTGRQIHRFIVSTFIPALLGAPLFSQAPNPLNSALSVIVQPSDGSGRLELVATNHTGKSIAAFTIALTTLSPSGAVTTSQFNLDLVPSYAGLAQTPGIISKYQHFGPLLDGEQLFRGIGSADNRITASVTAIVFDDNTVAGDKSWAQFNFDHRAAAASELSALVGTIGSPSSSLKLRDQIMAWRQVLSQQWESKAKLRPLSPGGAGGVSFARSFVSSKLTELSRDSLSDDDVSKLFKRALSYLADTADDMRKHSILVEVAK